MLIVCSDVTLGFVQGEDADDFNPDRFLGNLPAALAYTKDGGASFLLPDKPITSFLVCAL